MPVTVHGVDCLFQRMVHARIGTFKLVMMVLREIPEALVVLPGGRVARWHGCKVSYS